MTDAQQIAQTVGIVVGAASCCEQVTQQRINAVAVKLRELVVAAAADLANEQFSAALEEARLRSRRGGSIPNRQRSL